VETIAMTRTMGSEYMEWAKTRSEARFNLAVSGLPDLPLAELPVRFEDLELTAPGRYGHPPLLARLAHRLGVPTECVVTAAGASMANYLALDALLAPGEEALIEEPTYELLVRAAEHVGARIRRFPRRLEQGFALDPGEIQRALTPATRLIVITNLHNPSSALADEAALLDVSRLAGRAGARLLVDEVYLETLYDSRPWRSAFHLGPGIVTTNSLTKAFGLSGLRCGFVLAEPDLARRMFRLNDLFGVNLAHATERLAVVALDHLDPIAASAKALLAANRVFLDRFLDSRTDLECFRPGLGTVVFPRLKSGRVEELCARARDRYETSVVPGRFFGRPDHFRIGISGSTETVAEGLERLGKALDDVASA
jgi:aspartate/methionine/tyrosine aminotransferase